MTQEEGIVCSISEDGWAQVITQRKGSCAHCSAGHGCQLFGSGSKMVARALNRASAGVGDHVFFSLTHQSVVKIAAIVYLIPVTSLILGAFAGAGLWQRLGISESAAAVLLGLAGLSLGFLIMILISRWISTKNNLTPVITRVVKAGEIASGSSIAIDPCKAVITFTSQP